ncbi:radical SAM/SPASM domain-containing protein [Natronospora cellulosivora (SeqCode)]
MNDIVLLDKKKSNYYYYFNKSNGLSIRSEYKNFEDPFWSVEGPELLDVSITNYCERECDFCYRNSSINGKHMGIDEFESIMKYMKETNTYQVALGGGNPNQHPDFIEILKMCREKYGIVPSYTTNGDGLSSEILKATKIYCGAIAISYYKPYHKFIKSLNKLLSYGIKTNIHFLLTPKTIKTAMVWLKEPPDYITGINAVIFLNYKPVGNMANKSLLLKNSDCIKDFFSLINKHDLRRFKIGFDSCTVSGIVENLNFNPKFIEACEAGRFSAFISENMKLYPCSFMEQNTEGINLANISLKKAWLSSEKFQNIRDKIILKDCKNICKYENDCKGGCPVFSEINLCNNFK